MFDTFPFDIFGFDTTGELRDLLTQFVYTINPLDPEPRSSMVTYPNVLTSRVTDIDPDPRVAVVYPK
jgi:hypothetical protein